MFGTKLRRPLIGAAALILTLGIGVVPAYGYEEIQDDGGDQSVTQPTGEETVEQPIGEETPAEETVEEGVVDISDNAEPSGDVEVELTENVDSPAAPTPAPRYYYLTRYFSCSASAYGVNVGAVSADANAKCVDSLTRQAQLAASDFGLTTGSRVGLNVTRASVRYTCGAPQVRVNYITTGGFLVSATSSGSTNCLLSVYI